jgi:hypothetical protein
MEEHYFRNEHHDQCCGQTVAKVIRCKRGQFAKATLSIRCKFDPHSNEIDESELRNEKHDFHKCAIDDGTTNESINTKYRTTKRELSARNVQKHKTH